MEAPLRQLLASHRRMRARHSNDARLLQKKILRALARRPQQLKGTNVLQLLKETRQITIAHARLFLIARPLLLKQRRFAHVRKERSERKVDTNGISGGVVRAGPKELRPE